ncbi:MAG: methionine synthase [Phycisphaerales bacterium]|nr:methionine synthase [Phycisphaerales bacterium]
MKSRFLDILAERVLVFDGAAGTSVHAYDLSLADYDGHENCVDIVVKTRPDVVAEIHRSFLEVGSDVVMTNTFGANKLVLGEFGISELTTPLNRQAAEIARTECARLTTKDKPRFVIGSMGPGTRLPSLRQTTWDTLVDSYTAQARGLIAGGVDGLLVETCQDILQAKAAIVACMDAMAAAKVELPILCTVTIETTGTMLVGTEMAAAIVALEAYDAVRVLGINCATGPQEMSEHVRQLASSSDRLLLVQPNAGLPQLVDGKPHYALTPDEFTRWLVEFVEADGVNAVGGCCGTSPAHLRKLVEAIGTRAPRPRKLRREPSVSSLYQAVPVRQDNSFLIIGERSNTNGSRKFKRLLLDGDIDNLVAMGREQVSQGAHVLDVCVDYVGRDGVADMANVVSRYAQDVTVPLMLDSTEAPVIEAGLKLAGGRCIVNSINLEEGESKLERLCPIIRRYGAAVVALTIDEHPEEAMAKTKDRKLSIARRLFDLCVNKYGLRPHDLLFDCLTFPITTGSEADRRLGLETLDGIAAITEALPECHTVLGVSNVSFGLAPAARAVLNSVFLHEATRRGLTAAIVHAGAILPRNKISDERWNAALDLVYDRRSDGFDPLARYLGLFDENEEIAVKKDITKLPVEDRLKQRIINGDRNGLDADLTAALGTYKPLDIVNEILLDGMKTVGDLFGAGQMQLPFVLQSAETMKAAVGFLEPLMDRVEGDTRGSIVLATVRGDVHDIGKNLVDIVLTNNGYKVYNLGIKQPISHIIDVWQEKKADLIGLSGLLVKSTVVMRENLAVLNERGLDLPVILGGAALTRKYVEDDLRQEYKGPLYYARDAFEGLNIVKRVASGDRSVPPPVSRTAKETPKRRVTDTTPHVGQSGIARDVSVPTPPFWGSRVVERIDLRAVLAYINENMLFNVQWQYRKATRNRDEYQKYVDAEVRPIYRKLVDRCIAEDILRPQAVYGYWPCQSEGDVLIVFDPNDREREVVRFEFPRQGKSPFWCLSDFFRPMTGGEMDVVAIMIVTVGQRVSEIERRWFAEDKYVDYLHLHGLGVESAEALAEYLHKQVRVEWGIAEDDARDKQRIFQQRYRGSRYSFGYPACPRLEDQVKIWPLLDPERIGVTLSEEFQLDPEQSTTALISHHPEAKYFNVR